MELVIDIADHMDETAFWAEQKKEGCVKFHLHSAPSNNNRYPETGREGSVWNLIPEKNKYDMAFNYFGLIYCLGTIWKKVFTKIMPSYMITSKKASIVNQHDLIPDLSRIAL